MGWSAPKLKLRKFAEDLTMARKAESEQDFSTAAIYFKRVAQQCDGKQYRDFRQLAEKYDQRAKMQGPDRALETLGL